jgi:hypothetical protein
MKVAAVLNGQPRFTKEFDIFLENLTEFDQIDWFIHLWNNFEEKERVSPFMNNPINWNEDTIKNKIKENLPKNHRIVSFKISDPPVFHEDTIDSVNYCRWTSVLGILNMTYGYKCVNELKEEYEKKHGKYDLVVRTRPDVMIDQPISLKKCNEIIKENPNILFSSANHRVGIHSTNKVSDLMGISNSDTMSTYLKIFDKLNNYNNDGVPFHTETLIAHHLTVNNIITPMTTFNIKFRSLFQPDGTFDWGKWN